MSKRLPLSGVNILELTRAITGPYIGRILANCGATIVHVESEQNPDICRTMFPYKDGIAGINRAAYASKYNTDKYGITLDLKHSRGPDIMKRFIAWADIFIESNSPGAIAKYGLDYESVKTIKENIIMLSTSQMGQNGPLADFKGYGAQAAATAGFFESTGYPDSGPVGPFGSYTDMVSPQWVITVVVAALDYRRRTGKGQYIDHSQLEAGIQFLGTAIVDYAANGKPFTRVGNRNASMAPHGIYRCNGNDQWCTIAVESDEEWVAFRNTIENPHWASNPGFGHFVDRKSNEDELDKLIESWTILHSPKEVMSILQKASVAAGIVSTGQDLHQDPQLQSLGHFVTRNHTEIGPAVFDNPPFRFSKTPCEVRMAGPCLGEHNEYVFRNILGMSDNEFLEVIESGVLT